MAVPKRKTTRSKRDMRRSHDGLTFISPIKCPKCEEPKLRHYACLNCLNGEKNED